MVAPHLVLNEMIQLLTDEDASLAQLALSGPEYKVASNSQDKRHGLGRWLRMFLHFVRKTPSSLEYPRTCSRSKEVIQKLSPQISQNYDPSKFVLISELKGLFIKFSACSAQDILP